MSTCSQLTLGGKQVQLDAQPPTPPPSTPWSPTYENWTQTVNDTVLQSYKPRTLYELTFAIQQIEQNADVNSRFARAVGSKWSFSDITRPGTTPVPGIPDTSNDNGFIIDTTLLAGSLQHHLPNLLKSPGRADPASLVEVQVPPDPGRGMLFYVEAGITVTDLNRLLDHYYGEGHRAALSSTVGGSGQTVAGAISTSTHGAESNGPALADLVQAIYLVGPKGKHFWLEPGALCDPVKLVQMYPCLAASGDPAQMGIIQNNPEVFDSVLVSFGCMGVIYAVILSVNKQFGAIQHRRQTTWESLQALTPDLSHVINGTFIKQRPAAEAPTNAIPLPTSASANEFSQIVLDPYAPDNGPHACYVTNRFRTKETDVPFQPVNPISSGDISNLDITGVKNSLSSLQSLTDFKTDAALNDLSNYVGSLDPTLTTAQTASSIFDWMINYTIDVYVVAAAASAAIIAAGGGPENPLADAAAAAAAAAIIAGGSSFGFNKFMAKIIDWVLAQTLSLEDVWDVGYNVTDVESWGAGIASRSIEAAFASPQAAIGYANSILAELKSRGNVGDQHDIRRVYIGGYLSLRICMKTNALLGIEQFSPNTFIVEYAMLSGMDSKYTGGSSHTYEDRILDFMKFLQATAISMGGILHWGQTNSLLTKAILSAHFSTNLTNFIAVRNSHFHATTTFDNTFTKRLHF